jgi:hypothetical protein
MNSARFEAFSANTSAKSSWAISHVDVELKTNVSEICSTYIIRVNVMNDHTSHIYQSVKLKPHPTGVLWYQSHLTSDASAQSKSSHQKILKVQD